jgi:hypothetical protein CLOST_0227
MEETVIVVMLRNKDTGFLEKEICSLDLDKNEEYIVNIYVMDNKLYIRLSTGRDVDDWEYSAIYDYYDSECFNDIAEIKEIDDDYNPTWEVSVDYTDDVFETENQVKRILEVHTTELNDVFETIKDKESEYTDGE